MKPRVEPLRLSKAEREEASSQAMSTLERMQKEHEAKHGRKSNN